MKKFYRFASICLLALLAAACSSGGRTTLTAEEYLLQNVSVWNSASTPAVRWLGGDRAEEFSQVLQQRKGMSRYQPQFAGLRRELAANTTVTQAFPPPEDAAALHASMLDYLKSVDAAFAKLEEMGKLPDGYSDQQFGSLSADMERLIGEVDSKAIAWKAAQKAYAKQHGIDLRETGG
ncbi:hypothetical protein [Lysobacter sp. 1R34A]|uniref:hypothetical protein n=1 Tax=Lysobacter sp. 1R34A TaxID=3445786 RepID=UPI003EEF6470